MEAALRSMTKTSPFPQPPPAHQPPLLPLPAQAPSPQCSIWPATRPAPPAKQPRCHAAPSPKTASAPITVAAPSKKRVAPAPQGEVEWTETDSLYSVSPPPSCVPMPTSLLVTGAAARKPPKACAVEVSGNGTGAGVNVGATDELRRLLRL